MSYIRRFVAFVLSFFVRRPALPETALPELADVEAVLARSDIAAAVEEERRKIAQAPDRRVACVAAAYRLARMAAG